MTIPIAPNFIIIYFLIFLAAELFLQTKSYVVAHYLNQLKVELL